VELGACPLEVGLCLGLSRSHIFVRRPHSILAPLGEQLRQAISAALGLSLEQVIKLDLSIGALLIQAIRNQLLRGDPITSIHRALSLLAQDFSGVSAIINMISDDSTSMQALRNALSTGDTSSVQRILGKISATIELSSLHRISGSIGITYPVFPSITWDVYLDGISIKKQIRGLSITYAEDSVHNNISITSTDTNLFWVSNPEDLTGISRFEVHLNARVLYFLLETRSGEEKSFSLSGRSLSAREDSPFADDIDYTLETPTLASTLAADLLTVSSLSWECHDWVLPTDFEFYGPPIVGISKIAHAVGAVVRCEDDGTILVRKAFPVRPVDMQGSTPDVSYDRESSLLLLSYFDDTQQKYNAVEVEGYTENLDLPVAEVEESSPVQGEDVHVRLYWSGREPPSLPDTYVTDGVITDLSTEYEDQEEIVTFQNGIATLSKPLYSFTSMDWEGDAGENLAYTQYSRELQIDDEADRVGKIKYTTIFRRYRCSEHFVEVLLAMFEISTEPDISVLVQMCSGDKQAWTIQSDLLTSESAAVARGTAFLDMNAYDVKKLSIRVPYNDDAIDGNLAYILDKNIDCTGNFHIKSVTIGCSGPQVINELTVIQPQVKECE